MLSDVAVIGLGQFGTQLAISLAEAGVPVLAIDSRMERVEGVRASVARVLCLNSTDEDALAAARIADVGVAVCAIGDDVQASILTVALLRQLGVPRIVARSTSQLHGRILRMVGATDIVNPAQDIATRLAARLLQPGLVDRVPIAPGYALNEIEAPAWTAGRTIAQLDVRRAFGISILAVKRGSTAGEQVIANPGADTAIAQADVLVVLGDDNAIGRFLAGR
ncbi:MAG: TrkA family potassium uptake protein [Deltaproteobacteria bacterium]|nr:TrkA family potassium uptake protein [Deltaproteobacteria bacterium]